jgi:hypothetical protein
MCEIKSVLTHNESQSSLDLCGGAGGRRLEDVQSVDPHSYPPTTVGTLYVVIQGVCQTVNGLGAVWVVGAVSVVGSITIKRWGH